LRPFANVQREIGLNVKTQLDICSQFNIIVADLNMVVSFTAVYFTQPVASVIGVVARLAYLITTKYTDFMGNDRLFYFSGGRW
jgi:hypothetical protein